VKMVAPSSHPGEGIPGRPGPGVPDGGVSDVYTRRTC
jgi:hypothetical protein